MPIKTIFIAATDTNVGKTFISALLNMADCVYWKPVQSGEEKDADFVRSFSQGEVIPTRFDFAEPISPDQAAAHQGVPAATVSELMAQLNEFRKTLDPQKIRTIIVEGAGGLLTPLNARETWIDFICAAQLPVLLVCRSGLGTINHTALSIQCLQQCNGKIVGLVINGPENRDNCASIAHQFPSIPQHQVPLCDPQSPTFALVGKNLRLFVDEGIAALRVNSAPWEDQDRQHCWHPFTQHKLAEPPLAITSAHGVYLTTSSGEQLFDGVSSWWVNTIGHGRREIRQALSQQQSTLDHVLFAGATHRPAAELSARLIQLAGSPFSKVFFSDNGSTAVEVALKMAYQRAKNLRRPASKFLALTGSYHGDTFGAMSVGARSGFFDPFKPLLFDVTWIDPVTSHSSSLCKDGPASRDESLSLVAGLLSSHPDEFCALIIEPLVQGAAGMHLHDPIWLNGLVQLAQKNSVTVIADEVFTGFGRTGAVFAFQRAGFTPDIICTAKALTGGTIPLAATITHDEVYSAFHTDNREEALLHGHSFTANPISCATALAALRIMSDENLPARALQMEARYQEWIENEAPGLAIESPRTLGGILAFELPTSDSSGYFNETGRRVSAIARTQGLFIRPLGNTIYFAPPLSISPTELACALNALSKTLKRLIHP